jgi:hypothetical protein
MFAPRIILLIGIAFHLDDAVTARAAGLTHNINLTHSLDISRIKSVDMIKLATTPLTQEAAKAAFASSAVMHGTPIAVGDRLMVKTTEGQLAMIAVKGLVGSSNAGSTDLDVSLLTIP